jgi:predicted transcriptional regulator
MGTPANTVSDAELDVLKALWKGPATVHDVVARLRKRKWAYTTVLTLLSRLRDKQYVAADKGEGAALVFRAVVSREELLHTGLFDLADRICDGASSPLVHALVSGGKLSAQDVAQLRKMLDEMEE